VSIRKPHNNEAGYIASRRSSLNREWVVIYDAMQQGIDTCDLGTGDATRYAVVCCEHGQIGTATSLPKARALLRQPGEFCLDCREGD
jgi:hypothetical protein